MDPQLIVHILVLVLAGAGAWADLKSRFGRLEDRVSRLEGLMNGVKKPHHKQGDER